MYFYFLVAYTSAFVKKSGFPRKSEVFAGNASEPKTLKTMIQGLQKPLSDQTDDCQMQLLEKNKPTIVMDAGIATEENINWLKKGNYSYLVVSRKKHREFSEDDVLHLHSRWYQDAPLKGALTLGKPRWGLALTTYSKSSSICRFSNDSCWRI